MTKNKIYNHLALFVLIGYCSTSFAQISSESTNAESSGNIGSLTIDSAGVSTCSVTVEEAETSLSNFRKQQAKELNLIENVGWFLGPPKLEIIMREEKLNKILIDYKKGRTPPDIKCPLDTIPSSVEKFTDDSQKSIKAINDVEAKRDSLFAKYKCNNVSDYSCSYYIFKNYKDSLN